MRCNRPTLSAFGPSPCLFFLLTTRMLCTFPVGFPAKDNNPLEAYNSPRSEPPANIAMSSGAFVQGKPPAGPTSNTNSGAQPLPAGYVNAGMGVPVWPASAGAPSPPAACGSTPPPPPPARLPLADRRGASALRVNLAPSRIEEYSWFAGPMVRQVWAIFSLFWLL